MWNLNITGIQMTFQPFWSIRTEDPWLFRHRHSAFRGLTAPHRPGSGPRRLCSWLFWNARRPPESCRRISLLLCLMEIWSFMSPAAHLRAFADSHVNYMRNRYLCQCKIIPNYLYLFFFGWWNYGRRPCRAWSILTWRRIWDKIRQYPDTSV